MGQMGISLESFRTGIQSAPVDVTGAENKRQGFLVYSETEKGHLQLELEDLKPQSGGEFNAYVRSQLLSAMRDSLSALNRSGRAVDAFMAKAEQELFGPLGGDGKYGADKAFQNLECDTVQKLLDEFDSKFGKKSVRNPKKVNLIDIKSNLRPVPKMSVPKKSVGTGSVGVAGAQKPSEVGKPKINLDEWTELDVPQDQLTAAQRELRANCRNATSRQRSAVLKLEREFPYKDLGIGKSVAKGLKVSTVRPSDINGFLECHLEGPNGKADVLIDQAGVCSRKDQLSKEKVEADYQAFATVLDEAHVSNSVGSYLDVAKVFAHSDLKLATDLVEVLQNAPESNFEGAAAEVSKSDVVGVLLNKLAPALGQLPQAFKSADAPGKNVVACWKMLKLPEPAPKANDPNLGMKFLDGLKRAMFDDCMKALNLGPGIQDDPSVVDAYRTHFMSVDDVDALDAKTRQKVTSARTKIGWLGQLTTVVKSATNYIKNAGTVTGLSYEARLKCISDSHYVPQPQDFFLMPKLDYSVNGDVEAAFADMSKDIGTKDGRYHNVTFSLSGNTVWPGFQNIKTQADVSAKFGNFKNQLQGVFNKKQIIQLAHYLNDSALFVTGMGMTASDQEARGAVSITKAENGDMKVEFRRPSRRLSGIDKTCGVLTTLTSETTDDFVHRFTIGSDGMGKTDSIALVKNPNRSETVTFCNDSKVTEGQLRFLDKMAKDPGRALKRDDADLEELRLAYIGKLNSEGVTLFEFQKLNDEEDPVCTVKVQVDAQGLVWGEPEIEEVEG